MKTFRQFLEQAYQQDAFTSEEQRIARLQARLERQRLRNQQKIINQQLRQLPPGS